MNEVVILGTRVVFTNDATDVAVLNLTDTLRVVPQQHRAILRQIAVVPPARFGHGPRYAGGGSGIGYPRLSELSFDRRERPNNFPLNLTLLHEIGHVLEDTFRCMGNLTREHRAILRSVPIPASAHTHGEEEHFAIAYQQVMTRGASDAVRSAVLASRAFNGIDASRI